MKYAVNIEHFSHDQLEGFGFYFLGQDDEFLAFRKGGGYDGETHIVDKADHLLRVDDINDAIQMEAQIVLGIDR